MKCFPILFALLFLSAQCKTVERDVTALLLFKEEVQNRDPYWKGIMESWSGGGPNGEDDPCANGWRSSWEGVECRFQGDLDADVPRVVTNIHVTDSDAGGPVPMAISLLQDLVEVDMDGNKISGPLNPYIGCLSNLKELDLANNSLTGTIPTEWRFLTMYRIADWISEWSNIRSVVRLEEVELELNVGLTGCIPLGMPPEEVVCPRGSRQNPGPDCFLVGTIVSSTGVEGFCADTPVLRKRCPDVAFVEEFIREGMPYDLYFQSQALSEPVIEVAIEIDEISNDREVESRPRALISDPDRSAEMGSRGGNRLPFLNWLFG